MVVKRLKSGEQSWEERVTVNSWIQTDKDNLLLWPEDVLSVVNPDVLLTQVSALWFNNRQTLTTEKVSILTWLICNHGDSSFKCLFLGSFIDASHCKQNKTKTLSNVLDFYLLWVTLLILSFWKEVYLTYIVSKKFVYLISPWLILFCFF